MPLNVLAATTRPARAMSVAEIAIEMGVTERMVQMHHASGLKKVEDTGTLHQLLTACVLSQMVREADGACNV